MHSIHITELVPGDVVRICFKAGFHLNPLPNHTLKAPNKRQRTPGFARTLVLGQVVANQPSEGKLVLNAQGWDRSHFTAEVKYVHISLIQKYVTPDVLTEAAGRPGVKAFGTSSHGFMKLLNIRM
jgi:hypothetical protein